MAVNTQNQTIEKNLGPVSPYALAVEAGFDGTKEEWEQYMANAGLNAQTAERAKNTAVEAADKATDALTKQPIPGVNGNWFVWDAVNE